MCQFTVSEKQALEALHKICTLFLNYGLGNGDYKKTEFADGVCMELLINDLRITIERGPEVTAEIETAKAIEKASH